MATLKTCFKCSETKPLEDFYVHPQMGDCHLNKCKACAKRDVKQHRIANAEKVRAYDRARAKEPHRIEAAKAIFARWREQNPERRAAQNKVAAAVKSGRLLPRPCEVCGAKAEAHHPDYSQPLAVVWLCSPHHKQAHALVA